MNIIYDFSLMMISNVLAGPILLRQEDTYFMNVQDTMGIGTLEEIHLVTLSCFWVLIQKLSLS